MIVGLPIPVIFGICQHFEVVLCSTLAFPELSPADSCISSWGIHVCLSSRPVKSGRNIRPCGNFLCNIGNTSWLHAKGLRCSISCGLTMHMHHRYETTNNAILSLHTNAN